MAVGAGRSTGSLGSMRSNALILGIVAAALSVLPLFWMSILAVVQFGNLWMEHPYVREFLAIAAFWFGVVGAVMFFGVCVRKGLKPALSPYLLVPIIVGIAGGVAEEIMLLHNPKASFPIGFFELAPVSWFVAGVVVAKLGRRRQGEVHAA